MLPELVPILTEALKAYYSDEELSEFTALFDIELEYDHRGVAHLKLSRKLLLNMELGNNRRFLESLIPSLLSRCEDGIAHQTYERRDFHTGMRPRILSLMEALEKFGGKGLPAEIAVEEKHPFAAKAEVRDLLSSAETEVTLVDNYIGIVTLDCLRVVDQPIRILTGDKEPSIEKGFDRALAEFRSEGRKIEVHRHGRLHDRHVLLNNRCWLIGASLKDAGKKAFSMIEGVDICKAISQDVERKWSEATIYTV